MTQLIQDGADPSGPARAIVDHYRCPDAVAAFALSGRLSDDPGFFRFGPDTICFGNASSGSLSDASTDPLYDALPDVALDGGSVSLPFNPNEIVANLRCERYRLNGHGRNGVRGGALARSLYYGVRPFLTLSIRRYVQRAYLNGWKDIPFPRWPVDTTVDQCLERLLALSMKAQGLDTVPFIWFWPDRAMSCAIMTHDIEHLSGRNFCSHLMDLDDAVKIKSAFQIVPEGRYSVPDSFLDEIRSRGFEINVHDLNHNGRLFANHTDFLRAVERINEYGRRYRAVGFRSGALYRNQAWFDALEFSYDMSVPSVAHLDPQRGGCCTVMPFFIGTILELPVTTIQDYTLFHILNDYSLDVWKQQLDAITRRHGLASFIVHPDYVIANRARTTYQRLLEHLARLREERQMWIALPHEVDRWWRQRSAMRVVKDGTGWRIDGPNSERARIAFARLVGDELAFSFDDEALVQDATLAESLIAH